MNLFALEMPSMPSIDDFLPGDFLFQGTPFAINRFDLIRFVVLAFVLLFFGITISRASKKAKAGNLKPTKPFVVIDWLFEFIKGLVYDMLGPELGKKWLPMATTIFCGVFFLNITGIIPGFNIAASAGIGIPLVFALWSFTAYWRVGIKEHGGGIVGFFKFIKVELVPEGLPVYVVPIYAVTEIAQIFIVRPFSLTLRLFANMMTGHILLGLCYFATQFWIFFGEPAVAKPIALVTFGGSIFFTCFEMLVAALQAYVFTLLTCAYINMSRNHEAEHAAEHEIEHEAEHAQVAAA
jgi:F-type H+-transporting ATPase subunit a